MASSLELRWTSQIGTLYHYFSYLIHIYLPNHLSCIASTYMLYH